ncbi:hypothetical protein VF14_13720 [Nostoc linckia z18]|uniref:Uncharacterized protein n=2 Tax=Nostoc linckia TaxID=92942 RepID=A0A9Q5ZCE5_NOSLI|nr:hypothetical protein [Nostoc linckia]PHK42232.1 hypothetical protein VF12_03440 [Nostoc linckia z15]PHK45439.1 hypothetical protein VF13_15895 [Nostoc linckia z16]PHJ59016.1 hypothetical protein VF02_25875 [Nostoc linckia z1]PHJ61869.1 hypothetical protein VF05_27575 [Nostoc linckia z3]PHJ67786.1 hypothetical protein VF03_25325 [Nostoc linckia z2]
MIPQDFVPFVWPLFALVCVILFREALTRLIDRIQGFELDWPGKMFRLTATEANQVAQALLNEADEMIRHLGPAEKKLFRKIVEASEARHTITVDQLFEGGFSRVNASGGDSEQLISLRKLRDAQLIRPKNGNQFTGKKELEIKKFGQVLLNIRRKELLS